MSLTLFGPALNQIATVDTPGSDGCLSLDGATSASLQNLPPYTEQRRELSLKRAETVGQCRERWDLVDSE